MIARLPEIRPISDLAREARSLVERARERQEPIVITQRGRDAAVLVPIELYRRIEQIARDRTSMPRRLHPEDAAKFRMEVTIVEPQDERTDAPV